MRAPWTGSLGDCEFAKPVVKTTFDKHELAQTATGNEVVDRHVQRRVLSEVNGGAWAAIAELGVLGR